MRHGPVQVVTPTPRWGGLALPTAMAAVVCGGSVLAIALAGAVALSGDDHIVAEVLAPADRAGSLSLPRAGQGSQAGEDKVTARLASIACRSNAAGIPAEDRGRCHGTPNLVAISTPTAAVTASDYPVSYPAVAATTATPSTVGADSPTDTTPATAITRATAPVASSSTSSHGRRTH